jgi:hypothetical protein
MRVERPLLRCCCGERTDEGETENQSGCFHARHLLNEAVVSQIFGADPKTVDEAISIATATER